MADTSKSRITSLSVNQTQEFFAVATEHGFEVHKIDPLSDKQTKTNISEEVKLVQMMYKTSLVGIVLKSEPTKLLLWDDTLQKSLSELTFASPILSVRMRKDMIAVALQNSSLVFNINNFNCIETIETNDNLTGILSIATAQNATRIALACPHKVEGIARVHFYIFDRVISTNIVAHQNALSALSINPDGTLLASASNKGTIIRIFSTESGNMLQELRRGSKSALINQIIFNQNSKLLACCSDRPTIHVFELSKIEPQADEVQATPPSYDSPMNEIPEDMQESQGSQGEMKTQHEEVKGKDEEAQKNKTSRQVRLMVRWSFMKFVVPYFKSEWCYCKIKIPEKTKICAFGPHRTIAIVSQDRVIYYGEMPEKTGYCTNKIVKNI